MDLFFEILVSFHIVVGGFFIFVGSFGLVKLPDLMTRLHAPTKASTLGVGGALIASMLYFLGFQGSLSIHEILITVFLFITAPVTAHFIAKSFMHQSEGLREKLPETQGDCGWSTFDSANQNEGLS